MSTLITKFSYSMNSSVNNKFTPASSIEAHKFVSNKEIIIRTSHQPQGSLLAEYSGELSSKTEVRLKDTGCYILSATFPLGACT